MMQFLCAHKEWVYKTASIQFIYWLGKSHPHTREGDPYRVCVRCRKHELLPLDEIGASND